MEGSFKRSNLLINVISIVIPIVVALLLSIQAKFDIGSWTKQLPHVIGSVNTLTSIALVIGFIAVKGRKIALHRWCMSLAFLLGLVFLICYVTYHITNPSKAFSGDGIVRVFYFFALISHIALSLIVLPFVLRAVYFAIEEDFVRHAKIAGYAFPTWLYVSVTGVMVYLLNYVFFK